MYPQPVQKPYPQMWQPLTSPRSIEFAAQHGINGYFIVEPNARLKQNIDTYYEAAEKAGWPDRLDRGEFKYGWDASKPPRHHHRPLHPHRRPRHRRPRPRRPGAGGAVGLLRPVRVRGRARRSGRDRRHGPQGHGRGVARAQGRHPRLGRLRDRGDHEDQEHLRLRRLHAQRLVRARRVRRQRDRGPDALLRRGGHAGARARVRRPGELPREHGVTGPRDAGPRC